jgi:hypothetical protein
MSQETIAQLIRAVKESIARAEASKSEPSDRVMHRVLAHLWSALDELDLLSTTSRAA